MTPSAFLLARRYSCAYALVSSRLVAIDNSLTNRERTRALTQPPPHDTRTSRFAITGI
jgi:hypothetical protein